MKKSTAEVLAELTGDDRTVQQAATHQRIKLTAEPCDCAATEDHDYGLEEN